MLARIHITYLIVDDEKSARAWGQCFILECQARVSCELELEPLVFVQLFSALGLFAWVWLLHLVDMYILRVKEVRLFKNPFLCIDTNIHM